MIGRLIVEGMIPPPGPPGAPPGPPPGGMPPPPPPGGFPPPGAPGRGRRMRGAFPVMGYMPLYRHVPNILSQTVDHLNRLRDAFSEIGDEAAAGEVSKALRIINSIHDYTNL